jgi:hypothetical protein
MLLDAPIRPIWGNRQELASSGGSRWPDKVAAADRGAKQV